MTTEYTLSEFEIFILILGHPLFFFLIGACIGSFMNVVFYRYPLGKSIVSPGSACPECGLEIAFYDNVPIIAWLYLRGKCRNCGIGISPIYPVVEFGFAAVFAMSAYFVKSSVWMAFSVAFLVSSLLSMAYLLIRNGKAPWYLWFVCAASAGYFLYKLIV